MALRSQAPAVAVVRGAPPLPIACRAHCLPHLLSRRARRQPDLRQNFWSDGVITAPTFSELEYGGRRLLGL